MLIVEGPDGAGKTTLIEGLKDWLDMPVAPRVVSKDAEAMVDLRQWVDENLAQGFQRTIFDRHRLVSEPVYGPILRRMQEPGFDDLSWLGPRMEMFYHLQPVIVYCLPSIQTVYRNVMGDPDNKAVEHDIFSIYSAYVARAAIDLTAREATTFVWDYETTPTIKNRPDWLGKLTAKINERTK